MLTLAFGRAIGLVLLYFTTECPSSPVGFRDNETFRKEFADSSQTNIQICGSQLTSLITSLCDGYFNFPYEDNGNSNGTRTVPSVQSGVVEKCCKNPCNREFLLQHCAGNSNLKPMLQPKREALMLTNDKRQTIYDIENDNQSLPLADSSKGVSPGMRRSTIQEVGLRVGNERRRRKDRKNVKRGRRRRKPKWDCAYKSFGHYLLMLDHNINIPNKIRKRKNVPPLEVGTIKPDNLGGEPFVVGSRHGSPWKISSNFIS